MNWIPIKEKRPKDWQEVLIALSTKAVVVGLCGPMGWHWAETDNEADQDAHVTHWVPLPEAPKT